MTSVQSDEKKTIVRNYTQLLRSTIFPVKWDKWEFPRILFINWIDVSVNQKVLIDWFINYTQLALIARATQ